MSNSLRDQRLVQQIHEAVKIGAYGDADIPHNFWSGNLTPLPIRNRETKEVEFLLTVRDGKITYFRRSR